MSCVMRTREKLSPGGCQHRDPDVIFFSLPEGRAQFGKLLPLERQENVTRHVIFMARKFDSRRTSDGIDDIEIDL